MVMLNGIPYHNIMGGTNLTIGPVALKPLTPIDRRGPLQILFSNIYYQFFSLCLGKFITINIYQLVSL